MSPLIIAGGCYFETCEVPEWRAVYGSGGRAAHAVVGQTPVTLHTYFPQDRNAELYPLAVAGVDVRAVDCPTALAFAYFHPLSDPVLAPARSAIALQPSIHAKGQVVLRFGMVEGDAVVVGERVVYDPQSVGDFAPFGRNGSSASALALVLNADEVRAAARQDDINAAAASLLATEASVVIVKAGVHGAMVHSREGEPILVPPYWSDAVFKIGTGDVFSAAFAHAWGQLGQSPVEAAQTASRSVAVYTANRTLPLPQLSALAEGRAVQSRGDGLVLLVGSTARLADRWLFEEAAWRLEQLGVRVRRLDAPGVIEPGDGACLILADQIGRDELEAIIAPTDTANVVIMSETEALARPGILQTPDFATALYWACWSS